MTVSDMRRFTGGPKVLQPKQKCTDYIEKSPFMVIFLYNLYTFVWIHEGCLAKSSACIQGSLGVRLPKLPWDFQKSMPGSLGLPTFKDI